MEEDHLKVNRRNGTQAMGLATIHKPRMLHGHNLSVDPTNKRRPHVLNDTCWCNPTKESYRD